MHVRAAVAEQRPLRADGRHCAQVQLCQRHALALRQHRGVGAAGEAERWAAKRAGRQAGTGVGRCKAKLCCKIPIAAAAAQAVAHPTAAARLVWLGVEVALSRLLAPAAGLSPGREAARVPHGTGVTLGLFLSGKAPSARQAARSLTDQAPSSQDPETAWLSPPTTWPSGPAMKLPPWKVMRVPPAASRPMRLVAPSGTCTRTGGADACQVVWALRLGHAACGGRCPWAQSTRAQPAQTALNAAHPHARTCPPHPHPHPPPPPNSLQALHVPPLDGPAQPTVRVIDRHLLAHQLAWRSRGGSAGGAEMRGKLTARCTPEAAEAAATVRAPPRSRSSAAPEHPRSRAPPLKSVAHELEAAALSCGRRPALRRLQGHVHGCPASIAGWIA